MINLDARNDITTTMINVTAQVVTEGSDCIPPVSLRILWKYHQKMTNHRIDIRVRTLFSLSALLALGVLFIFRNSSITAFSTVSIESRSFF